MSMFFVERVARLSPPLRDLVFPFALAICPELLNVDSPDLRPRPVHVSTAPLWKVSSLQPPTCGRPPLQPPPCGRPALKTTHVGTAALGRPGGAQLAVFFFTMPMWGRLSNETASLRRNIDFSQIMPACLTHVGTAALGRPGERSSLSSLSRCPCGDGCLTKLPA